LQDKLNRKGYISGRWDKNTMGKARRKGETLETWRRRREAVRALFDDDEIADEEYAANEGRRFSRAVRC
jgi:hypothetical protein